VNLTREGLDYGTKIVGGVTPGRAGRDVYGVPVYDCVRDITAKQHVDGSIVTVPPRFTRDAVFEAIEAGVKLIVVVTERIPRGEVAQMVELARLRGARIIGPNCLGILSPDEAKMGGLGGPGGERRRAFKKGPDRRHVALGRDDDRDLQHADRRRPRPVDGRVDRRRRHHRLDLRRADAALRGRPGDEGDRDLLRAGRPHGSGARRTGCASTSRLPIVAFMAGRFMDEMPGMRFGHAGTIVEGKADTTADKIERMRAAGISVAERIEEIPALVKERCKGH
jgi:succinyl-CoA synthetase alpha subunit